MSGFYDIDNYHDLYRKCKHDFDLLKSQEGNEKYSYNLMNLIFSLNHLLEWYLNDDDVSPKSKERCVKKFNPYGKDTKNIGIDYIREIFKTIPRPDTNNDQLLIRHVCNDAKHYLKKELCSKEVEMTAVAGHASMFAGGPNACSNFHEFVYFVTYKGEKFRIEDIITNLLDEWDEFLTEDEIKIVAGE